MNSCLKRTGEGLLIKEKRRKVTNLQTLSGTTTKNNQRIAAA